MVKLGIYVQLEAKPGKEEEVKKFLKNGLTLVEDEPKTAAWFGMQMGPSTFGIFDVFDDESGRQAHLSGKVAKALFEQAPDLFAREPSPQKFDVLAAKLSR